MQKNRVLFVASPWLGGSGTVAYRLAEEIEKKGWEVHFLSYEKPFKSTMESKIVYHLVKGYEYPLFPFPMYELALAEEIVKTVVENDIAVIAVHYGILFGHAAMVAKSILATYGRKVKVVLTMHGSDVLGFDLEKPGTILPKHLNNWVLDSADHITVASKALRKSIHDINGKFREIQLVPNFIDESIYYPSDLKVKKKNICIHISNYRKVKQPLIVVKAFEQVQKSIPDAELWLVGEGPLLSEAMNYVTANDIKNVTQCGKIDSESEIAAILRKSKVMLLPSIFENFSLVAIEAQACGIPVVASNTGGIPEVVIDTKTGFLSNPQDFESMAQNIVSLLTNEDVYRKVSRAAVANAQLYKIVEVADQYIRLFRH